MNAALSYPAFLVSLPLASLISYLAYRFQTLTAGGAIAAAICGILAVAAGWPWAFLLFAYFLATTLLSKLGSAAKIARTQSILEKPGPRDAFQVFANGGIFAAMALLSLLSPHPLFLWIGLAALAASAADTWATELGLYAGGTPRTLLSSKRVPPGTSGGITWTGTLGALLGATFVAVTAVTLGWPPAAAGTAILAALAGAMADSLLGETLQQRRFCPTCHTLTERTRHSCGATTYHYKGFPCMTNDAINAYATVVAGLIAVAAFYAYL